MILVVPTKNRLLSNTYYLFLDWVSITSLGFLFWVILWKFMMPSEFGIMNTTINLAIFLSGVSLFGFNFVLQKLIPEFLQRNQPLLVSSIIRFSLKFVIPISLIFTLSFIFFSGPISVILKLPADSVFLTSFGIFLLTLSSIFGGIFYGFQNMERLFLTDTLGFSIKIILLSALILISALNYVSGILVYWFGTFLIFLTRFETFFWKTKPEKLDNKQVFLYSRSAFISSMTVLLLFNSQYIILSAIENPSTSGIFSVAFLAATPLGIIPATFAGALLPAMSELSVSKETKEKNQLINIVLRYATVLTVPFFLLESFFFRSGVNFLNSQYLGAVTYFPIMSVSLIFYGIGTIFLNSLYALGKTKTYEKVWITSAFIFLLLSILMTTFFSALGLTIAYFLTLSYLMVSSFQLLKKHLKLSLEVRSFFKIFVSGSVFFIFLVFTMTENMGRVGKILISISGFMAYLFLLVFLGFFKKKDVNTIIRIEGNLPFLKGRLEWLKKILYKYSE